MYDALVVVAELIGGSILLAVGMWGLLSPRRADLSLPETWRRLWKQDVIR